MTQEEISMGENEIIEEQKCSLNFIAHEFLL